jgi:hypothetical protein
MWRGLIGRFMALRSCERKNILNLKIRWWIVEKGLSIYLNGLDVIGADNGRYRGRARR